MSIDILDSSPTFTLGKPSEFESQKKPDHFVEILQRTVPNSRES
jgi:hypothetical protein